MCLIPNLEAAVNPCPLRNMINLSYSFNMLCYFPLTDILCVTDVGAPVVVYET